MRTGELSKDSNALPASSSRLQRLFAFYVRRMMRRTFRAVRLAREPRPSRMDGAPLMVISNHPSWWDPLVCLIVATTCFDQRRHYAPIDAAALEKYGFFKRLGFFGVEQNSRRGAATFLRTGERILSKPNSMLWVTPQGGFTDVRSRPVRLKAGVGHLARRIPSAATVPFAVEYTFGGEKLPEVWARFGPAIETGGDGLDAAGWTARFAEALESVQDQLAEDVIADRREDYEAMVSASSGVGGVYDLWRRVEAWSRGAEFHPEHGSRESR